MDPCSMVHRSGDKLIIRSVVSGNQLYPNQQSEAENQHEPVSDQQNLQTNETTNNNESNNNHINNTEKNIRQQENDLPQCKIKRNYSCNSCSFFTQNPRRYLIHLRDLHGEKIVINECKKCLYASRHYQKLVRHMKMVHGTTEGINELSQSRKRSLNNSVGGSLANKEFRATAIKRANLSHPIQDNNQLLLSHFGGVPTDLLGDDFDLIDGTLNNNKLLKCPVCEFTTLVSDQLLEHEKQEHSKVKFYRCIKCNYVTHIKTRFSKHVKYHSMPMIKCIICDFRTPYKWNLDRHMKNHGGTGQFKCNVCNFTADIKQSLTVHELNHHVPPLNSGSSSSTNLCIINRRKDSPDTFNMTEEHNNTFDLFQNNADKKYLEMMISEAHAFKQNWLLQNAVASSNSSQHDQDALNLDTKNNPTRKARPIPNLIPIQNIASPLLNLSKNKNTNDDNQDDQDDDDDEPEEIIEPTTAEDFSKQAIATSNAAAAAFFGMQRKNSSFFDKLKEKLVASSGGGAADHISFACKCGYNPKSLSDSILHQKFCASNESEEKEEDFDDNDEDYDDDDEGNLSINTSSNNLQNLSSSTRCQYCRHRCKSSIDLLTHLQTCLDAQKYYLEHKHKLDEIAAAGIAQNYNKPHPMENKIFVWNNQSMTDQSDDDDKDDSNAAGNSEKQQNEDDYSSANDLNYFGIETAPGYGEVTQELNNQQVSPTSISMKKVYKCPHCSFWASTASRFHVHIVGHLNKKPFECSLCAYRSNWRWDITKHIRLKTIRDSNHKTARVLMNDETGRRNYTKYNKYVTLMKVTDAENEDKKLKSGEMSLQNQHELEQLQQLQQSAEQHMKATIEYSNQHPFDLSLKMNNNTKPDSVPKLIKMPYNLFSNLTKETTTATTTQQSSTATQQPSTAIANFINENFDASKDIDMSASSSPVNESKKSHFKCKKCNFKDSNREVVLAHVKQHYHEAGLILENAKNQFMKTTMGENFMNAPAMQQKTTTSTPMEMMMTTTPTTASVVSTPVTKQGVNAKRENGETNNETNSHQHGRGVWRGPAPYRCGHCHQVSNWKHVIQRHCRLKHNGIILIESNNVSASSSVNTANVAATNKDPSPSTSTLSQMLNHSAADSGQNNHSNNNSNLTLTTDNKSTFQSNLFHMKPIISHTTNHTNSNLNNFMNKKKHQCSLCPYVTESKAQLLYHKSFHKPKGDPFQCNWCSYNVAKKHLLNQHKKMHKNDMMEKALAEATSKTDKLASVLPTKSEAAIDLTTTTPPMVHAPLSIPMNYGHQDVTTSADKQLFFCSLCPARYLSLKEILFHKQMHNSNLPNKCEICTYTSTAVTSVHLTVHTFYYLEKTREFQSKYKTNEEYPQPNLTMISMNNEFYYITTPYVEIDKMHHDDDDDDDDDGEAGETEQTVQPAPAAEEMVKENSEKCPHCPFYSCSTSLKDHLQSHKCISGRIGKHECEHCDFSNDDLEKLNCHKKLHFLFLNNNNNSNQNKNENLHYYTQYENIEITIEKKDGEMLLPKGDTTIYKENNNNSDNYYYKFIENEHRCTMNEKIILSIP